MSATIPSIYVKELVDALGTTLVAFMACVRSRQEPLRWAGGGVMPAKESRTRLLMAYEAWVAISSKEGDAIARQWFIGANPWIAWDTPAERVRANDPSGLRMAANAFLTDQGGA